MSSDQEGQQHDDTKSVAPSGWTGKERRRPGRVKYVNPHLIALLRGKPSIGAIGETSDVPDEAAGRDDLGSAKGILLAVVVSATIWSLVVLIVRTMLRGFS